MIYYTVDIDNFTVDEVCHTPCGVFDSEEEIMKFIKTDPDHLEYLEENSEWILNLFYIVHCWELNKYRRDPINSYKIFRKDL